MNYKVYRYTLGTFCKETTIYLAVTGAIAYVFYRSLMVYLFFLPGLVIYLKIRKGRYVEIRKKKLVLEFSETLNSVSVNLRAGYSIENAFLEAYKDMRMFYGEKSLMAKEIVDIRKGLEVNKTLETLICELGQRSGAEDIVLFAEVLTLAKRNGGNIPEVLSETAEKVHEKICTDNEIDLLTSEKRLELRIMEAVPFLIPVYLEVTSEGYFDVLYEDYTGRVLMTGCLIVYLAAVLIGNRIMRIDV